MYVCARVRLCSQFDKIFTMFATHFNPQKIYDENKNQTNSHHAMITKSCNV